MVEVRRRAIQQCKLIVRDGRKIALLRDIAIQLGCDVDVVSDLQYRYGIKKLKLDYIKLEHKL